MKLNFLPFLLNAYISRSLTLPCARQEKEEEWYYVVVVVVLVVAVAASDRRLAVGGCVLQVCMLPAQYKQDMCTWSTVYWSAGSEVA